MTCFFVSDLHGWADRYRKLFDAIRAERPSAVFLGGDILPSHLVSFTSRESTRRDFINDFLTVRFSNLLKELGRDYPRVFLILGNDDPRVEEAKILDAAKLGIWEYIHGRQADLHGFSVHGYCFVPPTPFHLKDWEKYDISQFVDPECVPLNEGYRSVPATEHEIRHSTIKEDLETLVAGLEASRMILLFHTPPYQTNLDRAALDGMRIDRAPLDPHIGSIAVRRFIQSYQPFLTLHGHVHESTRLTGSWKDTIGKTQMLSAAHDGPELALIRFDLEQPEAATRELL